MRLGMVALIVTLAAPAATWAQAHEPVRSWLVPGFARMPGDERPRDPLPEWSVPPLSGRTDVPLPSIGLPLPPIGLQPLGDRNDPPRHHRRGRYAPSPVWVVVVPQFAVGAPVPPPVAAQPVPAEQVALQGTLILHVKPDGTEVFVDGYYVGAAADLSGDRGGVFLDAGPHRIDLSAPGHEPVTFDVKIAPNQPIIYRRDLKQIQTLPSAPSTGRTPVTFYLIPGCYAGNVSPKDASLPPTCDITRALIIQN